MNKQYIIEQYLANARKYINTPFRHQGRDKNGMDCIGIITVPLNEIGFFKYDNTNYRRYGLGGEIFQVLNEYCDEIENKNNLEAGDILMFSKGSSQHLAIYTGKTIIHSNNLVGKVVEQDLDDEWKLLITKVFRYREEE